MSMRETERGPLPPYYIAAEYNSQLLAEIAYITLTSIITNKGIHGISAFNFQYSRRILVVALGDQPNQEFTQELNNALSGGEITPLEPQVLRNLNARRRQELLIRRSKESQQ